MMDEDFTYNRSWEQIIHMLEKAEQKQNWHFMMMQRKDTDKSERMMHMRNYKGLEGVSLAAGFITSLAPITTETSVLSKESLISSRS